MTGSTAAASVGPTAGAPGPTVPVIRSVLLSDKALDVTVAALNREASMATSLPCWEGPVTVTGSHPGRGYLEMTGYRDDRVDGRGVGRVDGRCAWNIGPVRDSHPQRPPGGPAQGTRPGDGPGLFTKS